MVDNQIWVEWSHGTVFESQAILHLGGGWLVGFPANVHVVQRNIQDSDIADDGRCCVRSCRGSRCSRGARPWRGCRGGGGCRGACRGRSGHRCRGGSGTPPQEQGSCENDRKEKLHAGIITDFSGNSSQPPLNRMSTRENCQAAKLASQAKALCGAFHLRR